MRTLRTRPSPLKQKVGCFLTSMVFIASLVAIFMFGGFVGSEITQSVGWNVTSPVVNFIIGCLGIWLIAAVLVVVLMIVIFICVGIYITFFGK